MKVVKVQQTQIPPSPRDDSIDVNKGLLSLGILKS